MRSASLSLQETGGSTRARNDPRRVVFVCALCAAFGAVKVGGTTPSMGGCTTVGVGERATGDGAKVEVAARGVVRTAIVSCAVDLVVGQGLLGSGGWLGGRALLGSKFAERGSGLVEGQDYMCAFRRRTSAGGNIAAKIAGTAVLVVCNRQDVRPKR